MSAARDLADAAVPTQQAMAEISRWIDESPANKGRAPLEALLLRALKIGEENGEMVANIIGWTGQNPRKGVTATLDEVIDEALDIAATALMFVESATGNRGAALPMYFDKIIMVRERMTAYIDGNQVPVSIIAPTEVIDKFLGLPQPKHAEEGGPLIGPPGW